jgi:hypothetical protein
MAGLRDARERALIISAAYQILEWLLLVSGVLDDSNGSRSTWPLVAVAQDFAG